MATGIMVIIARGDTKVEVAIKVRNHAGVSIWARAEVHVSTRMFAPIAKRLGTLRQTVKRKGETIGVVNSAPNFHW